MVLVEMLGVFIFCKIFNWPACNTPVEMPRDEMTLVFMMGVLIKTVAVKDAAVAVETTLVAVKVLTTREET
jgi:hypothetical protein